MNLESKKLAKSKGVKLCKLYADYSISHTDMTSNSSTLMKCPPKNTGLLLSAIFKDPLICQEMTSSKLRCHNESSRFTNFHILHKFNHDNKSKSCESQVRSASHHFTGKSKQNITTIKPFSLESRQKDSFTFLCCSWHNAFW